MEITDTPSGEEPLEASEIALEELLVASASLHQNTEVGKLLLPELWALDTKLQGRDVVRPGQVIEPLAELTD